MLELKPEDQERELDVLIAEKVRHRIVDYITSVLGTQQLGEFDGRDCRPLNYYSDDLGDTLELLDEWQGDVSLRRTNGTWRVEFFEPSHQNAAWDESLPKAICQARLKMVENQSI